MRLDCSLFGLHATLSPECNVASCFNRKTSAVEHILFMPHLERMISEKLDVEVRAMPAGAVLPLIQRFAGDDFWTVKTITTAREVARLPDECKRVLANAAKEGAGDAFTACNMRPMTSDLLSRQPNDVALRYLHAVKDAYAKEKKPCSARNALKLAAQIAPCEESTYDAVLCLPC